MKTVVLQSFRTDDVPHWIERCMQSVRDWSDLQAFDYEMHDDSSFALCGDAYLARVGRNLRAIVNLSRLELAKAAHARGYDRTIWLDADVLVYHPKLFTIDIEERYAFARETWVARHEGRWGYEQRVNNCAFVCMKDEPDLETLIKLTRDIGVHRKIEKSLQTGTYLLTGLQQSLAFETLDNVGLFSNHVVKAIASGDDDAMALQATAHGTPVFAANLCASDRDPPTVSETEAEQVIDRLLDSKGDIINRGLLKSKTNLLNVKSKPGMIALFPHEQLVKLAFKQKHGYEPDLANPRSYNEFIAANKINLIDPIYRDTADKYAARQYVADRVGEHILVPLLQVADSAEEIDFDALPLPFILKPTHGSGWKAIVEQPSDLDPEALRATMRKWLRTNFFHTYFEIHYRDIPRRIVAEKLLRTSDGRLPGDNRFHVLRGAVRMITSNVDPFTSTMRRGYYDRSWRRLAVIGNRPAAPDQDPPPRLDEMIEIAETLGRDFPFVRIDLHQVDDKFYFSEITHTPVGGQSVYQPRDFDVALGNILTKGEPLPERFYAVPGMFGPRATPAAPRPEEARRQPAAPPPQRRPLNSKIVAFNSLSHFDAKIRAEVSRPPSIQQANAGPLWRNVDVRVTLGAGAKRQDDALVSCVMFGGAGHGLTKLAIAAFRKQTWARRELLIVDSDADGDLARIVSDIGDPSIRLLRSDGDIGNARSVGLDAANGSFICSWQASVLHHPARIEAQMGVLKATRSHANMLKTVVGWIPARERLSWVGGRACETTLLAETSLLKDGAALVWRRGGVVMDDLAGMTATSRVDTGELCVLVAQNEPTWTPGREDTEVAAYRTTLDQLAASYPIQDARRAMRAALASIRTVA